MLILEKSDKTRYITLGFLKWSPFFIPFSFLDFSHNVLENQQRQIAHFGNNVFIGLVIKVTSALQDCSQTNRIFSCGSLYAVKPSKKRIVALCMHKEVFVMI